MNYFDWLRLEERGVHGAMLKALQPCYNKVMMRVKVNAVTGDPFESKQRRGSSRAAP